MAALRATREEVSQHSHAAPYLGHVHRRESELQTLPCYRTTRIPGERCDVDLTRRGQLGYAVGVVFVRQPGGGLESRFDTGDA